MKLGIKVFLLLFIVGMATMGSKTLCDLSDPPTWCHDCDLERNHYHPDGGCGY